MTGTIVHPNINIDFYNNYPIIKERIIRKLSKFFTVNIETIKLQSHQYVKNIEDCLLHMLNYSYYTTKVYTEVNDSDNEVDQEHGYEYAHNDSKI